MDRRAHNLGPPFSAALLFSAAAGLIHLLIVAEHWAHSPGHGLLLGLAGAAQLLWVLAFWRWPSQRGYRLGVLLNGGLITLWALTRVLRAPFGPGPEAVDLPGLLSLLCEGLAIVALAGLAGAGIASSRQPVGTRRSLANLLVSAAVGGLLVYTLGQSVEPHMPWLQASATGAHGHAHSHGEPSAPAHAHGELQAPTQAHDEPLLPGQVDSEPQAADHAHNQAETPAHAHDALSEH